MTHPVDSSLTIPTDRQLPPAENTHLPNSETLGSDVYTEVNLSDPEELEAHLQVLGVRQRLRERRRRMIRWFSFLFIVIVTALIVGIGLTIKPFQDSTLATTGSNTVLPPPPADLSAKCSAISLNTPQGIEICEEACEIAECCNVPEGFALSCTSENTVVCAQYQRYCDVLYVGSGLTSGGGVLEGIDASVAQLKSAVDQACTGKSADELEQSTCMALCQAGFCCFSNPNLCGDADCQAYSNCALAFDVHMGNPIFNDGAGDTTNTPLTLSEKIDQACGSFIEAISPPGEDTCETLCAQSVCCFNQYCVPSPDIDCLDYAGCYVLYSDPDAPSGIDLGGGIPTQADQIHEACFNIGNLNDALEDSECTSLCGPGACCFESNLDCVNVDCGIYAECNILYPSFLAVSREEVNDACNNHRDIGVPGEPTLCEQVCSLHVMQCCFHLNNEDGCDNPLQQPGTAYCDTYAACEVLGDSPTDLRGSHKEELEAACSNTQTRNKCITLCSAATCCYASVLSDVCSNMDSTINCDDYSACDVLYDASS